jgi:hypothetical protein
MQIVSLHPLQVAGALDAIAESIGKADVFFNRAIQGDEWGHDNAAWYLELAYAQLLTLAEALGLPILRADILQVLEEARAGMTSADVDPDGEPHLKWASPARRYMRSLQSTYASESSRTVTKDVESILRAATYPLSDPLLFGAPPDNESTLHARLEGILRCIFPDLRHKPRLTKPIKHFEPDTGIPSIGTLLEYKYLSSDDQVAAMADELLADTRGYESKDWTSFIYVIYEAARIRPESEWRQLLRDCGVDARTSIIVLSGERDASDRGFATRLPGKRKGHRAPRN